MSASNSNHFHLILEARIPLAGDLRRIYHKLNSQGLSNGQVTIVVFRIVPRPSSSDLVIMRRRNFEDFLERLPAKVDSGDTLR